MSKKRQPTYSVVGLVEHVDEDGIRNLDFDLAYVGESYIDAENTYNRLVVDQMKKYTTITFYGRATSKNEQFTRRHGKKLVWASKQHAEK